MNIYQLISSFIGAGSLLVAIIVLLYNTQQNNTEEQNQSNNKYNDLHSKMLEIDIKLNQVYQITTQTQKDVQVIDEKLHQQNVEIEIIKRDLKTAFNHIDEVKQELK